MADEWSKSKSSEDSTVHYTILNLLMNSVAAVHTAANNCRSI